MQHSLQNFRQEFRHIDEASFSQFLTSSKAPKTSQKTSQGVKLFITKTAAEAEQLNRLFASVSPDSDKLFFPDWETLPYDRYAPSPNIIGERF